MLDWSSLGSFAARANTCGMSAGSTALAMSLRRSQTFERDRLGSSRSAASTSARDMGPPARLEFSPVAGVARRFTLTAGNGGSADKPPAGVASTVDAGDFACCRPASRPAPKPARASSTAKRRVMGFMSSAGWTARRPNIHNLFARLRDCLKARSAAGLCSKNPARSASISSVAGLR